LLGLLVAGGLCGCSTQDFSIRRLPDETPAADNAAAVKHATQLKATAAAAAENEATAIASGAVTPLTPADAPSMYTYDPLERMNRSFYRFNARFDNAIFLPVTDTYNRLPSPVRTGVRNFFLNLSEPKSVVNYVLQLRPVSGLRSVGRFVINSTVGIGGLFDVATRIGLRSDLTGFSATLARWGMHPGAYLVIPLLGPSTLRDGVGQLSDYAVSYWINVADLYRGDQAWALGVLDPINLRAGNDFRYYSSGSPFEYETIRFLYVHQELIQDEALHAMTPGKVHVPGQPAGR
jgi:phospholipid-binding lipoprotein MlaA